MHIHLQIARFLVSDVFFFGEIDGSIVREKQTQVELSSVIRFPHNLNLSRS